MSSDRDEPRGDEDTKADAKGCGLRDNSGRIASNGGGKRLQRVLILGAVISAAAVLAGIATFRHNQDLSLSRLLTPWLLSLIAFLPPIWLSTWITEKAFGPLVVFCWRFMIFLPALVLGSQLSGTERNCFVSVLLACYFVGLPLESWLLVREARQLDS